MYLLWGNRCGAYISENHIAFQGESDSNVGMYAASEIKAGTILMGIPAHTILIPRVGVCVLFSLMPKLYQYNIRIKQIYLYNIARVKSWQCSVANM